MTPRPVILAFCAALAACPALAETSGQHLGKSAVYSGLAVSHGSAAVVSAAASVVSVPVSAFGAALAISGAGIESLGQGSLALGADLARTGHAPQVPQQPIRPDGRPTLD